MPVNRTGHKKFTYSAVCLTCGDAVTATSQQELALKVKAHHEGVMPELSYSRVFEATFAGKKPCPSCLEFPFVGKELRFIEHELYCADPCASDILDVYYGEGRYQ